MNVTGMLNARLGGQATWACERTLLFGFIQISSCLASFGIKSQYSSGKTPLLNFSSNFSLTSTVIVLLRKRSFEEILNFIVGNNFPCKLVSRLI